MKYIFTTVLLLCIPIYLVASDTLIYSQTVTLDTVYSQYDNVDVYALTSITLDAGFSFSSNGNGKFTATADPYNIEDPLWTLPEGTKVDSTGTLDGGYVVGTIPGQYGVSPSGAATYTIPIEVPKGNLGMEPQLTVNYNSQAGNGILGRGWNLGGISSIIATGKTRYYDNESTFISSEDTACRVVWDGQRLIALNNAGLEADSFRTEILSNVKITTTGSGNTMWFTVKTPDGRTMEYGNSTDSRLVLGDSTQWKWMLTSVNDRNGNTIKYTYTKDESIGEVLLSEIEYGGSIASPVNKITFHYTTRSDLSYAYIHDDLVIWDQLLDSISMESNSNYYGSYGFQYSHIDGESLLNQIIRYDKDNYRYNATQTVWEKPVFNILASPSNITIDTDDIIFYHTGDYNGDGYMDLVRIKIDYAHDSLMYYMQQGSATGLETSSIEGNLPRAYIHKFWDVFTEFISMGVGLGGCGYEGPPALQSSLSVPDISYVLSGDFDGDGKDELFVKVMEWEDLMEYLPDDLDNGFDSNFYTDYGGFLNTSVLCPRISFFTGTAQHLFGSIGYILNLDKPDTSPDWKQSFRLGESYIYDNQYTQLPDLEGRGYSAFPYDHSMAYYDPINDTVQEFCDISSGDTRWCELNGDGKTDYIDPANTTLSVYTYDESTNSYSSSSEDGYFLGTIDLNGDGISAWVAINEAYEFVSYATLWLECTGCYIMDPDDWGWFLDEYGLEPEYGLYVHQHCDDVDNQSCREDFLDSDSLSLSIGYELFLDHFDGRGPRVSLGYYEGTHELPDDPLFTRAVEADIDADGKNELLLFSDNILKTIFYNFEPSYSSGVLSFNYDSLNVDKSLSDNVQIGDFNGDGITELLFPDEDKSLCFITSGKPGKLISAIQNGMGVESRFSYAPLTDTDVYTKQNNAYFPVIDFKAPWYVVSSVARDNGVADSIYQEYNYEGAKIHLQGKGFLGFMKTTVENDLLNTSQISTFDYDKSFFLTYPDTVISKIGSNEVVLTTNYTSIDSLGLHKYRVETDSVEIVNNELGTNTLTTFQYNNNGFVTEKETEIGVLATITESYTYTNAGWYISAKPVSITKLYNRSGSTETDSIHMNYSSSTGNLTQRKLYCGTDRELTVDYNYDSFGNLKKQSITGKRGQNLSIETIGTDMTYTSDGRFLTSKSDTLDYVERYSWDLSTGLLESQTASNRKESSFEYGPMQRQKKIIGTDYLESASVIQWAAAQPDDSTGSSLYVQWSKASGTPEVLIYFDEVGRELRKVTTGFSGDPIYTDTEYNSKGQVNRKTLPYFTTDSKLWTTYTYDNYGRLLTQTSPDAVVTTYDYNGLETTITVTSDTDTTETRTELNALGETIVSEDYLGNIVSNYYLPDGKLKETRIDSHSSDTTYFSYDAQGNRISIIDPDAGTITSLYDAFGQLLRQINAKEDTTIYQYDALGRINSQSDDRGNIYYSYISDTTTAAFGMVDSIYNSDKSIQEIYTYDSDFGRLLTQNNTSPGKSFTNTYTYDWFGRPMTRIYPSGFEVDYSYTSNGDLNQVIGDGLTLWNCSDANALGQITSYSQGGYSTSASYTNIGRLSEVTTGSIYHMQYEYDDLGNLTSREDLESTQEEVFTYDKLNRLTHIEYYDNYTYKPEEDVDIGYDNCGNITSKTWLSSDIDYGEVDAGPHALTTINDPDTSYTPVPQIITYNCFNKVSSITDTLTGDIPLTVSFDYGLGNQRIKTTTTRNSTVERVKYFDSDYEEDSTSSGVKKYHYINGGTGLTAIFVKEGSGNDTMYYVLSDNLGSLTTIVNATSNEVKNFSYDSWGIPRDAEDWTNKYTGELFVGRGFTGHEHLPEFNLINMNGRIYDPVLGRFLSPDPIIQAPQYPNSYNRYSYALNNPLRFVDPSGYKYGPSDYEREKIKEGVTYSGWFWNPLRPEFHSGADNYFNWYNVTSWLNSFLAITPDDGKLEVDLNTFTAKGYRQIITSGVGLDDYTSFHEIFVVEVGGKMYSGGSIPISNKAEGYSFQDPWDNFTTKSFTALNPKERVEHMLSAIKFANENTWGRVNMHKVFYGVHSRNLSKAGMTHGEIGRAVVNVGGREIFVGIHLGLDFDIQGNLRDPIIYIGGGFLEPSQGYYPPYGYINIITNRKWSISVGESEQYSTENFDYLMNWIGW